MVKVGIELGSGEFYPNYPNYPNSLGMFQTKANMLHSFTIFQILKDFTIALLAIYQIGRILPSAVVELHWGGSAPNGATPER